MKQRFLLIFMLFSICASAQQSLLERKGSFSFSGEPLEKVIPKLKEIYSVEFSYSDDVVPLEARLSLTAEGESLSFVLNYLEKEFNIRYKQIGRRIVLSRKYEPLLQTVRGIVKDQTSRLPIPAASILVVGTDPPVGGVSAEDGYFKIPDVPVGRWDIQISCIGYNSELLKDVVISTGKELVLEVGLAERVSQMGEHIVMEGKEGLRSKSAEAAVSAYSFSVEESKRYAGSVGDPARMAANFAGVRGTNDENNALMIRGNSPRGVHWRIEGIEVPNPNHFTTEGASSGVVSILSPNIVGNSSFFTGAFPAEYGNALSGVFEIGLRNGNNEKREHSFQLGVLGLEASTEGPVSKKGSSSYLFNYRYSTLNLLDKAGVELNRAEEYKNYQDIAFKLNFPDTRAGSFSLFGLGGLSRAKLDGKRRQDHNYSDVGIAGLTHQKSLKGRIIIRSVLSLSATHIFRDNQLLNLPTGFLELEEDYSKTYARGSFTATKKVSPNYMLEGGAIYSRLFYNFFLRNRDSGNSAYEEIIHFDEKGQAGISQGFVRARQSISPVLLADYGLHFLHFGLTNDLSLEPRIGVRWKLSPSQGLNFGYGKHSKVENLQYYLARDHQKGGHEIQINKDLGFTRARHFVLGYENFLRPDLRFKTETYYQHLSNAPVRQDPFNLYSALNEDTGFITDTLINGGKGRNYGIEFSLEKSFSQNFYYLLNGSLYQSKFRIGEGQERNSSYNGTYSFNFLAGYESEKAGFKNQRVWGLNIGGMYAGGTPYIPIDEKRSEEAGAPVFDLERAYEVRLPDYFRADLQLVYKMYRPEHSIEWRLDLRNLSNKGNPAGYFYDHERNMVRLKRQIGLLPILSCRVDF